jgi:glycosyltransferase involved in cell wall biosynthesis
MIGAEENALEVRRETLDEERIAPHVSRLTSHISPLPGGLSLDMSRPGALAQALAGLTPGWIAEHGRQARERALAMFSKETVIRQYVEYYQAIMKDKV